MTIVCAAALLGAAAVIAGVPLAHALARCVAWLAREPGQAAADAADGLRFPGLLMRTALAVGSIGVIACLMAAPAAWVLSRGGKRAAIVAGFVAVPLMLPSYLAYAGWGLVRGPRTLIGDWLASGTNAQAEWKTTAAGHAIAVWGLALWAWPLAAYVLSASLRRITPDLLDALRLDGGAPWRRWAVLLRLSGRGVAVSIGVVMLVMLGSVVPLDVAQVQTFSIHLLRLVTQRQHIEEAWIAGWPVYVVALTVAVMVGQRVQARPAVSEEPAVSDRRPGPVAVALVAGVWCLAVMAPMGLFLHNMREPPGPLTVERIAHLSRSFWRECESAILASAGIAGAVGVLGLVLMLLTWMLLGGAWCVPASGRSRWGNGMNRLVRAVPGVVAGLFLVAGLVPGTLIGSAVNRAWNSWWAPGSIGSSQALVVLAHLARFGSVALLLGWWFARQETAELRDLRHIDGATGVGGWSRTSLAAQWPVVPGAFVLLFVLSFHEIEATVQVQQPGRQALAQQLLDWLHMARDENLAAAAVNLLGLTGGLGLMAGWLLYPRRSDSQRVGAGPPSTPESTRRLDAGV